MSTWKEQRSLKWPILVATTALGCLVVSTGALLADHWRGLTTSTLETTIARNALSTALHDAGADARELAAKLSASGTAAATPETLTTSDPLLRGRALLLAQDGRLLAAAPDALDALSVYDGEAVPPEKAAATVDSLLMSQEKEGVGRETIEGPPLIAVAPIVGGSGARVAVVTPTRVLRNLAAPDTAAQDLINAQANSWIAVSVFAGVLIGLFGLALAAALRRRLKHLVAGAAHHAQGEYDHRLPVQGTDEFAALAMSMNTTAMHFQQVVRQLQESERRVRRIIEDMGDGFVMLDGHDKITFCNRRFSELLGRPSDTLLGLHLDELLDREGAERFRNDAAARRQGRSGEYEFTWAARGGAPRTLDASGPVFDQDKRWAGSYAVITDITARARAQREMAQTEKLQALGEMAGGVAHDFNNVLTVVLGNTQFLLMDETEQPEHQKKALRVMERAALDGTEMVRRIREFTKTRAVDLHPDLVDPNDVVEMLAEMAAPRVVAAGEAGSRIEVIARKTARRLVRGNAAELREALLNVVFNAIDAMPDGGTLTIESFDRGEDSVGVRVEDSGIGMDSQTRNKIFDPFYTTKGLGGPASGLGLSTTFGIVRSHGGRIDVRSAPGEGATFTIVLPAKGPDGQTKSAPAPDAAAPRYVPPDPRLLMIGPEGQSMNARHEWLSETGTFAAAMSSIGSALAIAGDPSLFNVIAVQRDLPGKQDGWQLAREIRSKRPDVRIILIATAGRQIDETQTLNAGIDMVIYEPFDPRDLQDAVRRVLATPRPPSTGRTSGEPTTASLSDDDELEGELLQTDSTEVAASSDEPAEDVSPDEESLDAFNQRIVGSAAAGDGGTAAAGADDDDADPVVIL